MSSLGCACYAEAAAKPKVTPLMQFLHDKHSLKPEKKAVVVPVKKVTAASACCRTWDGCIAVCSTLLHVWQANVTAAATSKSPCSIFHTTQVAVSTDSVHANQSVSVEWFRVWAGCIAVYSTMLVEAQRMK